eukprot:gene29092-35112_t
MAAKLRAEVAELEAENQKVLVESLTQLFNVFDTNKDGKISVEELRDGLNNVLKESVSKDQASKILEQFDTSGDGALQIDEFKGIESFRSKLDRILAEERKGAVQARLAANEAKEAAKKAEAIAAMINNAPPTFSDKLVSIIPFILPTLDLLPYGKSFILGTHIDNNPLIGLVGFLYALYQTVPFSGLIAFFLFNVLSANLQLNRLVRYNIQLAIFIDIALIVPGVLGSLYDAASKGLNSPLPHELNDVASTATFLAFSSAILYAIASSLAGKEPDKIPFVTERIKQRVPTTEEFQKMYEEYETVMKEKKDKEKQKDASKDDKKDE